MVCLGVTYQIYFLCSCWNQRGYLVITKYIYTLYVFWNIYVYTTGPTYFWIRQQWVRWQKKLQKITIALAHFIMMVHVQQTIHLFIWILRTNNIIFQYYHEKYLACSHRCPYQSMWFTSRPRTLSSVYHFRVLSTPKVNHLSDLLFGINNFMIICYFFIEISILSS